MSSPVRPLRQDVYAVALIARDDDWQQLRDAWNVERPGVALGREWMSRTHDRKRMVVIHTGEDEMSAAVSAQYAVDRWRPKVLAAASLLEAFDHVAARNRMSLLTRDGEESPVADWITSI